MSQTKHADEQGFQTLSSDNKQSPENELLADVALEPDTAPQETASLAHETYQVDALDSGTSEIEIDVQDVPKADEVQDLQSDADFDDSSEDSLTFSNGVIEKIVALAMREVPGVVGMKGSWFNRVQDALGASDTTKGVTVEVTPDSKVAVNISVLIQYGAYAPQVFEDVKEAVCKNVTGMTGLLVAGVNLRIEDVLTEEEYDRAHTLPYAQPDSASEEGTSIDAL